MTLARRVAVIESSLTPTELVLRWLDEAQAFGDLESYIDSLLGADVERTPLDRLAREAVNGARASMRGKSHELVDAAVRRTVRETVFRFELVMRINVTAHELLERERLIDAALSAYVALLTSEGREERLRDATYLKRFASIRDVLTVRVHELRAAEEARAVVEARYFDGHPALFPDAIRVWADQLKATEAIADLACRLAELDGVPPPEPADPDVVSARARALIADLVEPAKATALEKLGEGERALGIATAWLRARPEHGGSSRRSAASSTRAL